MLLWSQNSWISTVFLDRDSICFVQQWEKSMGYHFVPECNHAQESHFFVYFCHIICRTRVCWDPDILLPWQFDVTTSPLHTAILSLVTVSSFGQVYIVITEKTLRYPCQQGTLIVLDYYYKNRKRIITQNTIWCWSWKSCTAQANLMISQLSARR